MRKLGARNCVVSFIDSEDADAFVKEYHRQGSVGVKKQSVGLHYKDELVGVMQFCAPRTRAKSRSYTCELVRMCFKSGVRVNGGASKMFTFFLDERDPHDVFTYQDSSGDLTDVYEHCGMSLVGNGGVRKFLVAPDVAFEGAVLGETMHTLPYVVERGPDAILGTNLGEKRKRGGKRKTNVELFESLGWRVEESSPDLVYEWINPDRTFYVYRITASDSDGWYVGMHHLKWADATTEEMLDDGYWGSGGVRFTNWWNKHYENVSKEILFSAPTSGLALCREIDEIGTAYRDDPNCLNSRKGGAGALRAGGKWTTKTCPIHGERPHFGEACASCRSESSWVEDRCKTHGMTLFHGGTCWKCHNEKTWTVAECPIHGEATYHGDRCWSCATESKNEMGVCPEHGETLFYGGTCRRCSGLTAREMRECPEHGLTSHWIKSGKCLKCNQGGTYAYEDCEIHGRVKHQRGSCQKCKSEKQWTVEKCPIHGEVKFNGGSCYSCATEDNAPFLKKCPEHGMTKHRGRGKKPLCLMCASDSKWSMKECPTHGMSKHIGDACRKCVASRNVAYRDCPIHGNAKHFGKGCLECRSDKTRHNNHHVKKNVIDDECRFCSHDAT